MGDDYARALATSLDQLIRDASLPFYEQAATLARTAAETQGENGRQAWAYVARIIGNWALMLGRTGDLDASRQRHLDSVEAEKKAGQPVINVIGSKLEALRIDIMRGQAGAQARPWNSRPTMVGVERVMSLMMPGKNVNSVIPARQPGTTGRGVQPLVCPVPGCRDTPASHH